ncbi:MAG: cation-efflux pump, partial [Oscillospiraceae bacterium]|nr:cation-efflux pump [Oscillospiraceae bacterium]
VLLETGIQMVIHSDPITVNNEYVDGLKAMVLECAREVFPHCNIHDFRITDGENRINLIFDLVLTDAGSPSERDRITNQIKQNIQSRDERFNTVITVEEDYSGR